MDVEYPVEDLDEEIMEEEEEDEKDVKVAKEHKDQLERLKKKDPEFYQFLREHDKELLEFDEEDIEEEVDTDVDDAELQEDEEIKDHKIAEKEEKPPQNVITTEMVESWCNTVRESGKIGAVRSLLKAFRIACHYGDDGGDDSSTNFMIMSSSVFNKIMLFVLSEMDRVIRQLLGLPDSGGKKEIIINLMGTRKWKNYSHLVKSYLGNALHVLNQMTDAEMISFTLRRLKYSSVLLAAFPSLLRKYVKGVIPLHVVILAVILDILFCPYLSLVNNKEVALHFWGIGGGALPVVSFLFLRDLCVRLGSDCLDECFKGIYKAYVLNCQFINAVKLQHIQFLRNCVIEILGVDLPTAYQHAFILIRQLAMILRDAITMKTKESFRKVYEWKFMNCLELWTGAICAYSSEADLKHLAYPLAQIISGVARLVPTARYFPLRLRCVKMLNRIAAATGTFIPVSMLLLDMLEMKELHRPPTGGVGKSVDLRTILKMNKPMLKTRAFQEACVFSVVEELAEHLAQWSYSVAFFELSFIPLVRLRSFCKTTKIERFRKEMRQLIRQIEANSAFTNGSRKSVTFLPNEPAASSFLEDEKKRGGSPLSKYTATLRQRAQERSDSLMESSVLVGEQASVFKKRVTESDEDDDPEIDNGAAVFSSSWLPDGKSKTKPSKEEKKRKKKAQVQGQVAFDEDVVEDLVLSSDEDDASQDEFANSADEANNETSGAFQSHIKKQKLSKGKSKKKSQQKKSKKTSSATASYTPSKVDGTKPSLNKNKTRDSRAVLTYKSRSVQSNANKSKKRKRST